MLPLRCIPALALTWPPHPYTLALPPFLTPQYCASEEEAAAAFMLRCAPQHVPAVLALAPPQGEALHPRLARLQDRVRRRQESDVVQSLARLAGYGASGASGRQLAGTGPARLAGLLRLAQHSQQQETAIEAAAAEQQGRDAVRTPEQSLSRRLWFHLLRTLAVLCLVPLDCLLGGLPLLSRRQVLCGRSLSLWCAILVQQSERVLGHPDWRRGVLDHVLCLALAALPEQLPVVMSMANLFVSSW